MNYIVWYTLLLYAHILLSIWRLRHCSVISRRNWERFVILIQFFSAALQRSLKIRKVLDCNSLFEQSLFNIFEYGREYWYLISSLLALRHKIMCKYSNGAYQIHTLIPSCINSWSLSFPYILSVQPQGDFMNETEASSVREKEC